VSEPHDELIKALFHSSDLSYTAFIAEQGEGQCITCGFLSKVGRGELHAIEEVMLGERASGSLFSLRAASENSLPACYLGHVELVYEFYKATNEAGVDDLSPLTDWAHESGDRRLPIRTAMSSVLRVCGCSHWTRWIQHQHPSWHLEHKRMTDMEEMRKDFQRELNRLNSEGAKQLAHIANGLTLRIGIASILVAVVIGGAQIWTTYHPYVPPAVQTATPTASPAPASG
jgi:hypothetical protein